MENSGELLFQLKNSAKKFGHSPNRREIPNLAIKCSKQFGSFNKAKLKAGLGIKNVKIIKFPKNAFKLDKDMAKIVSYITFDGHLYKSLRGFYLSAKNINDLREFEKIVKRKFALPAYYHLNSAGSKNQTHIVYFFNKIICKYLYKIGSPKGCKVIQEFGVPNWILKSKEFSREYLKIAYLCEGSFKEEKGRTPRITINTAKCVDLLDSGIDFMNTLRNMLKRFDINSLECRTYGNRIRKDNLRVKDVRFRVKIEDNNRFIREIGWLK